MQIKIKKQNQDGIVRLESKGAIKDVAINEDFLHPDKESISIMFRGENSSGIIDLTPQELENVFKATRSRMHLIKGFKQFKMTDEK